MGDIVSIGYVQVKQNVVVGGDRIQRFRQTPIWVLI